jgi:hypothetical protein
MECSSPDFLTSLLPRYGETEYSRYIKYRFYERKEKAKIPGDFYDSKITETEYLKNQKEPGYIARPGKIVPFVQGFAIRVNKGTGYIEFREVMRDTELPWKQSIIKIEYIRDFYEYVSKMRDGSITTVPKMPLNQKIDGGKISYSIGEYCSLGPLCCQHQAGKPLKEWVYQIRRAHDIPEGSS